MLMFIKNLFIFFSFIFFSIFLSTIFQEEYIINLFDHFSGLYYIFMTKNGYYQFLSPEIFTLIQNIPVSELFGYSDPIEKCCYSDFRILKKYLDNYPDQNAVSMLKFYIRIYLDLTVLLRERIVSSDEIPETARLLFADYNFQYIAECYYNFKTW